MKKFFLVQTRRLATFFEPLNSSLPFSAPELRARKDTCEPIVLARKSPNAAGRESVNYFSSVIPNPLLKVFTQHWSMQV